MNATNALLDIDNSITGEIILNRFVVEKVTAEERLKMISEMAYFLAELRGFQGGSEEQDWIEAEIEIARQLAAKDSLSYI